MGVHKLIFKLECLSFLRIQGDNNHQNGTKLHSNIIVDQCMDDFVFFLLIFRISIRLNGLLFPKSDA